MEPRLSELLGKASLSLRGHAMPYSIFRQIGLDHWATLATLERQFGFNVDADAISLYNVCTRVFGENYDHWEIFLDALLRSEIQGHPSAVIGCIKKHRGNFNEVCRNGAIREALDTATMCVCRCGETFGDAWDGSECGCYQVCPLPYCQKYLAACCECRLGTPMCAECKDLCECTQKDYEEYNSYEGCCPLCDGLGCDCE